MEKDQKGKRLQNDLSNERNLLKILYNQPENLDNLDINEGLFSTHTSRDLYYALVDIHKRNEEATPESLYNEYYARNLDAEKAVVDIIAVKQDSVTDVKAVVDSLTDFRRRRKIADKLEEAKDKVEGFPRLTETSSAEILDTLNEAEKFLSIVNMQVKKVMTMAELTASYEEELNKRRGGKQYWFRNWIFDNLIDDGPRPGEIGILASMSGSGKSTAALMLVNNFINCHIPCMYLSLEMSTISTMDRLLSMRTGIPYKQIANPRDNVDYENDIIPRLQAEDNVLNENKNFRFSEDPSLNLQAIKKHIQKFQTDTGSLYCVVVIDLLSMVKDFQKYGNGLNSATGIEYSMNELSAMAKECGCHIIGILQTRRDNDSKKINDIKDLDRLRPSRDDVKGANAWLERARYVIMTFRKKPLAELYCSENQPDMVEEMQDIIEFNLVKANNSKLAKMDGLFEGEHFNIIPLEKTIEDD